ncbi:hypothetical protein ACFFX1_55180 [Dactylosporangium sucinum]|uniref:Uncharacterized protein n=1 Tax=Dactylosporangium sucinum TaxID=1424081 RepID=A0A917U4K8_9ACTN|nr:hypothetical protein [Dactylosporangium sucinum]GGM52976.1 hypothetical protein GCM10007977_063240 [Dactylosporangium sucinum]
MHLSTDDDIYRARLVYLGPPGYTFPIQLPYAQYGLGALVFVALETTTWLLTGGSWSGTGIALGATLPATALIWRHVDPDRPARKVIATAVRDWRRTQPTQTGPTARYTARKVQVTR